MSQHAENQNSNCAPPTHGPPSHARGPASREGRTSPWRGGHSQCQLRRVASRTAARTSRFPRMLPGGAPRAERRASRVARQRCDDLNVKNWQERGTGVHLVPEGRGRGQSERRGARRGRDRGLGRLLRLWFLVDMGLWRWGRSGDYHWSRSWPLAAVLNGPV